MVRNGVKFMQQPSYNLTVVTKGQERYYGRGNATNQRNGDHKRSARIPDGMFFHLGLGSGFVVGIWVVLCTMLFKKIWRIAYFRLFDRVYDKLCVFIIVGWARLEHRTQMLIGKLG
ncbi:hypothetical protein BRADI_4g16186v3 [Brachypodium distachyon]|uniref:Uncharacterized protein n=1 Tax=Brachypodium distachyon TaxID=15368 RepID=A0A2K2CN60_BRADI|nr:hypothetical protein BRADI_4g16186v3 [Brachypodium distachyon]